MSQHEEAAPEEKLRHPPREAWPLVRVLSLVLMKMGRAGPPFEPRRRPQAGKSGDPRSQNADNCSSTRTKSSTTSIFLTLTCSPCLVLLQFLVCFMTQASL